MRLRDIEFGHVFNASGARGFFGEGYWFHKKLRRFGLRYEGSTFIAKTITLEPNEGHMEFEDDDITSKEWWPKCVKINFWKKTVLNAVGLSNRGAEALLQKGLWQTMRDPFIISLAPTKGTRKRRLAEWYELTRFFQRHLPQFSAPVAFELNFSCGNTGLNQRSMIEEVPDVLDIIGALNAPLILKVSALIPPEKAKEISDHRFCDAIAVSNAIPWGELPAKIPWKKLFGSPISPLIRYGGGALSGAPIRDVTIDWVRQAREIGISKPILGGGGILAERDMDLFVTAGVSAFVLGSVSLLRPLRVKKLIDYGNFLFKNEAPRASPV